MVRAQSRSGGHLVDEDHHRRDGGVEMAGLGLVDALLLEAKAARAVSTAVAIGGASYALVGFRALSKEVVPGAIPPYS